VKSIGLKQTFWLSGYYDDFNGARAIADDLNDATIRTHDHENSHHGSIFGGTNILNPRYAYSYIDRLRSGHYASGDPVRAESDVDEGLNTFITNNANKLTINRGIHEWLTIDPSIGSDYEHRSNLQHPSSLSANRVRFNGASGSSYLNFTNGHDTSGSYFAPMGVMDLTFGADSYIPADSSWFPAAKMPLAGGYARIGQQDDSQWALSAIKRTHFASVYTGEGPQTAMDITESRPDNYLHDITSPSEMPFLINNIYSQASSGTERLISYDGPLRLRGLGEVFHIRMASHRIMDGVPMTYSLKIGYKSSATFTKSTGEWSDTTPLATVAIDLATLMSYSSGVFRKWDDGESSARIYNADEIWADIYVVFDHAGGTWKAYLNDSTTHFTNGSIAATGNSLTTSKGWSLDAVWANLNSKTHLCTNTLIDRVGVILPLNYNIGNTVAKPEVGKFAFKYGTNNVSTLNLSIYDDSNEYALAALTTGVGATEWRLLAFRDEEERPIWSGVVESLNHKQNKHQQTLETIITARDSSAILNRVLPLWETGGSATFSLNEHISMSSTSSQVNFDTLSLLTKMNMGASSLTVGNSDLGHNFYNVVNSVKFQKDSSARTHLNSGSAIQMYMGEDEDGPNFPDKEWAGFGFDNDTYSLSEIIAVQHKVDGTANTRSFYVEWEEATDPTFASSGVSQYATVLSTYKGLAAGDTITVKGTGYDGDYAIATNGLIAHKRRYNSAGNGSIDVNTYLCEIRCDFTGADETTDRLFEVDKWTCKSIHYRSKLDETTNRSVVKSVMFELRTRASHSLAIGDVFILPSGIGTTGSSFLKASPLKVVAVPSATTVHVELESWPSALAVSDTATVTSNYGMAYNLTKINSDDSKRYPLVKPVLFEGALLTDAEHQAVKNRNIHARIMRDLPLSPFFKAQFGIIDAIPLWRAGAGSNLNTPKSAQYIATHGAGSYNSNGTVTGWDGLHADIAQGATSIVIDEPAILHLFNYHDMRHGILELVDIETNDSQHVIFSGVSGTLTEAATSWDLSDEEFTSGSGTWTVGNIVIHEGFSDNLLNGLFQITAAAGSGVYKASKISFEAGVNEFAYMNARNLNASSWNYGTARHYSDPDGVKVRLTEPHITERRTANSNATFEPVDDTGTIKYLNSAQITLTGVKGVKRKWQADKTIYSLRNNSSDSYKHLYVLWADMRNDGTADADGGFRKNDFGLLLPTSDNYKVQLTVADQFNEGGEPDVYTELKIGEDIDIWKFDAESEPYTGNAWCSLAGGSNDEPLDTRYANWDETAGAFVIIDASRYYNLNTAATGGRSGYSSGGQVDFGDYTLAVAGTPYLTDSYWKNAVLSFKNNDDATFIKHKNQKYMINDFSFLNQDIALSDTTIFVDDVSQFDTAGYGAIVCRKGDSRSAEDLIYYYSWTGKGVDATKGDKLTGVYITSYPNGNLIGPKSLEVLLKADVAGGATGSNAVIDLVGTDGAGVFKSAIVYNTTAALFSLRLMTNLQGYIPSANSGTFFAHDKLRTIFNLLTADTWAKNSALPLMYNFGGVPNTKNMTITQLAASGSDTDSFGSIIDAKATTVLNLLNQMSDKEGSGIGGNTKTFTWSVNRDNMLTFRPSYASGHTLTRSNMLMSSLNTQIGSQATNIRVFYNGNTNYADYPEAVSGEVTRWRILQQPKIFSADEALSIAKQEYARENTARVSITAQMVRAAGESDIMLYGARYGYVQDVFRQGTKAHIDSNASWCNIWGGSPFSGIQSALESAQTTFNKPAENSRNLGKFHSAILQTDTLQSKGVEPRVRGPVSVGVDVSTGSSLLNIVESGSAPNRVHTAKFAQNGGSPVYGATKALADGWNFLEPNTGSTQLSIYCQSGLGSRTGTAGTYTMNFAEGIERGYNSAYSWHGSNSLSYALNIIHVDKGTNLVSATTTNKLRLAITIDSGSTADNVVFRVWLLDYTFDEAPDAGNKPPQNDISSLSGSSSVLVNGNGYYPITIPSSYQGDTSKKLFVSVNVEYLRALVRKIITGSTINAHNIDGLSTYSSFNLASPFPLGVRQHPVFGHMGNERASYYAPRVAIVKDINYLPSTTLTFTDTHIDLETQTLSINSVGWSKDEQQVEKVILGLERTERHFAYSLAQVISGGANNPAKPESGPPASPDPSPAIPPSSGGGDAVNPRPALPPPTVGGGSSQTNNNQGYDVNMMSNAALRVIKGRASFSSDTHASAGSWGIIGQKKPSVALSSDRDIDGIDSILSTGEGVAMKTNEGFVLAGITDSESGEQGEIHTHSMTVRVPNDISTGIVGLEGALTLDTISSGGSALITTTITCKETGQSISQNTTVAMGTSRESTTLLTTQNLDGAETAGNTLVIEISRSPARSGDSAPYQSLVIHNTSVKMRRNSIHSNAQSDNFKPY